MHRGLDLARPRRRWRRLLALPLLLALWLALPRLAAAAPAGLARMQGALGDLLLPRYTAELADLRQQNAALHEQLARSADALAENEALRSLVGAGLPTGRWQPARVVARRGGALTLACTAGAGAPLLDPQGRYAGRVVRCYGNDTCLAALAGTEEDPCAGLAGAFAGLLDRSGGWRLTGLPADCGLTAGTAVTTPGGYWLGTLAEAPRADGSGLTAEARLTDTADLGSTIFFVKY